VNDRFVLINLTYSILLYGKANIGLVTKTSASFNGYRYPSSLPLVQFSYLIFCLISFLLFLLTDSNDDSE